MPDVGVLNLQIHDNSSTAAEGLGRLAAKLEAVKAATGGVRLGSVATGIKRINDELKNVQPSAIYKLKQLADVLEKIGSISGNVGGIRISFGGRGQNAEDIAAQMQAARADAAQATAEFEQIGNRIQEDIEKASNFSGSLGKVNEIVQQTGWSAQTTAEQFYDLFNTWNSFRMSNSLNAGSNPLAIGDGSGGSGAGWAYWKDGAIEAEGTVSDAMETIRLEAGQTIPLLTGIVEENEKVGQSFKSYTFVEDATEKVESLRRIFADSSDAVKQIIANIFGIDKNILFQETAASNVQTFGKELQTAAGSAKELSDSLERDYGKKMVEDLVNASSKTDLLKMRIDSLKDSLARGINNNTLDGNQIAQATSRIQDLQHEYDELIRKSAESKDETKSLSDRFTELMFGTEGLNGAFKRMFPTISGLLSRFKNLVKYRMLRAVIKQISEGFREGTENYYKYSEAIGGSFAPAMDNATSALLQMKNSIGAAAAPVIQALIPYLQMAVNWFITAINYANQFFALLGGQTSWSRAVPQTAKAFDNVKKSAGGASAAMKDLLADWDELNIIQSESGGGGGGGGAAAMEDYLNMFEESSVFDNKIKDIVEFVKENFDDILSIVEKIGAALLLWKVSSAFTGLLGTLAGLAAAGLTAAIVFEVSTLFTNEYLKTGDIGWLVADILSTAVGAYFGKTILDKVLGGAGGDIFIPLAFALSATASIIALVEDTNVDAFSEKGLLTALTAALEGGVAAGYLAHIVGGTLGESLLGGVVGTIGTFGIAIALKADAKVSAEGITPDAVRQQLVGIGSLGVAGAIAGAKLGAKFGVGAAAGAAQMGMLFAGLPIATFGVSVGLHAINTSVDMGGITPEVIKENITSAALVGTGLAMSTVAFAGGTVATLVGVGGAAVTLAVLFGLEAILSEEHMTIDWGNKDLTEKQVKSFVEGEVFTVSPNTILSLIDPAIEVVTTSEEGLQAKVDQVKLTANKIVFGINKEESLKELEEQIFGNAESGTKGLIESFKETAKNKQNLIETGFSLVPNVDDNGNVINIVDKSSEVWSMLTGHMDDLGRELSTSMFKAYDEQLTEDERKAELETIAKLTQMMSNVSEAIIKGEEWELAMQTFEGNIGDLSKGSWMKIVDYIDQYKNDIRAATEKAYDEVTRQMAGQVRALKVSMDNALELAHGDENDSKYKMYKDEYEYWNNMLAGRREGRKKAIDDAMDEAMDEKTIEYMRNAIVEQIKGTPTEMNFREAFRNSGIDTGMDGAIDQFFMEMFDESGNALVGTKMKRDAFISGLISSMFPEDSEAVLALMDSGILRLADIIPKELMTSLASNILQNKNNKEVVNALVKFLSGDFQEGARDTAAETGKEIADIIKDEYLAATKSGVSDGTAEMDQLIAELAGKYGAKAVEDVLVELHPEVEVTEVQVENIDNTKQAIRDAFNEAIANGIDESQFDSLQAEMIGKYGIEAVESVLDELESGIYDSELPEMDLTQPVEVMLEEEYSVTGDRKAALENLMNNLFPESNVDLLNRPVLDYGDYFETLFTSTITAGVDKEAEIPWNADIVMNLTPIMPDGTKLTDNELREYVQNLLGGSSSISELFWNDSVENGGKGLLINILDEFDSLDEGITKAVDLAQKLHELQELYYGGSGGSGGGGAPSYYANMGASVMQGINATFANMKNILPWMNGSSDVTVKETRDSGEEIGNTAEGTRQGTSEIVTGQNTMNGYMQQVAMSTAGMVDSQGTANSYMAQMVSLLRTIASQGGGAAPAAQSVMGGMVAGALAAFEAVRG